MPGTTILPDILKRWGDYEWY